MFNVGHNQGGGSKVSWGGRGNQLVNIMWIFGYMSDNYTS